MRPAPWARTSPWWFGWLLISALGACGGGSAMNNDAGPTADGSGTGGTASADGGSGGAGGAGTGTGGSTAAGGSCGAITRILSRLPPDILIILDRSQSMLQDPLGETCGGNCGPNSKWSLTTAAIEQVVRATETSVNWGLKLFPSGAMPMMCEVTGDVEVPMAPLNAAAIATAMAATQPSGSTPTRAALTAAATYLATLTDANQKHLLLATDGLPICPLSGPRMTDDSLDTVGAVSQLAAAGITTFVVGVATEATSASSTLEQLAIAGGRARSTSPNYYAVLDTAALTAALQEIVGTIVSCTFNLGEPPNASTSREAIEVLGNGARIPRDTTHRSGWDYASTAHTAIQLYGPSCEALVAGTLTNVTISFLCVGP